jgi:hypothetical protein
MIFLGIVLTVYFNLVIYLLLIDNTTARTLNDYFKYGNGMFKVMNITAILIIVSIYLFAKFTFNH